MVFYISRGTVAATCQDIADALGNSPVDITSNVNFNGGIVTFETGFTVTGNCIFTTAADVQFDGAVIMNGAVTLGDSNLDQITINGDTIFNHNVEFTDDVTLSGSGTDLVLEDGVDINVGSTNGTEFGQLSSSKIGFWGTTPVTQASAYTVTNGATDRSLNVTGDSTSQVAAVLGTLIADLQRCGMIG